MLSEGNRRSPGKNLLEVRAILYILGRVAVPAGHVCESGMRALVRAARRGSHLGTVTG